MSRETTLRSNQASIKKICSTGIRMKPLLNEIEKKIKINIAEDNIIKGIRNLFRLKKKKDNGIKDK